MSLRGVSSESQSRGGATGELGDDATLARNCRSNVPLKLAFDSLIARKLSGSEAAYVFARRHLKLQRNYIELRFGT